MNYILDGKNPVLEPDLITWGIWYEKYDKAVAKTNVDDVIVSTVFLALEHGFDLGQPILFETMVFGGEFDQEMARYTTWEDAEIGHQVMVEKVEHNPRKLL